MNSRMNMNRIKTFLEEKMHFKERFTCIPELIFLFLFYAECSVVCLFLFLFHLCAFLFVLFFRFCFTCFYFENDVLNPKRTTSHSIHRWWWSPCFRSFLRPFATTGQKMEGCCASPSLECPNQVNYIWKCFLKHKQRLTMLCASELRVTF